MLEPVGQTSVRVQLLSVEERQLFILVLEDFRETFIMLQDQFPLYSPKRLSSFLSPPSCLFLFPATVSKASQKYCSSSHYLETGLEFGGT